MAKEELIQSKDWSPNPTPTHGIALQLDAERDRCYTARKMKRTASRRWRRSGDDRDVDL